MKQYTVLVLGTFLIMNFGCKNQQNNSQEKEIIETEAVTLDANNENESISGGDNSRNALDWNGTYQGTLPCADCEGILTRLTLMKNGQFKLMTTYLGEDKRNLTDGTFYWDESGSNISLKTDQGEPQMYKVGENRLFLLDRDGNRITGDLADQYILTKNRSDENLENKKWILFEIFGKEFKPGEGNKEAFLYFDQELGRFSGSNSCNIVSGDYVLNEGSRISFGQANATLMSCPDMETADQFSKMMETVDNYSIADGILSLNKARMAPLAKFRIE